MMEEEKWGEGKGGEKIRGRGKRKGEREKPCYYLNSQPLVLNLHFWWGFILPDTHSKGYGHVRLLPKCLCGPHESPLKI